MKRTTAARSTQGKKLANSISYLSKALSIFLFRYRTIMALWTSTRSNNQRTTPTAPTQAHVQNIYKNMQPHPCQDMQSLPEPKQAAQHPATHFMTIDIEAQTAPFQPSSLLHPCHRYGCHKHGRASSANKKPQRCCGPWKYVIAAVMLLIIFCLVMIIDAALHDGQEDKASSGAAALEMLRARQMPGRWDHGCRFLPCKAVTGH